jgi:hypothetical protein
MWSLFVLLETATFIVKSELSCCCHRKKGKWNMQAFQKLGANVQHCNTRTGLSLPTISSLVFQVATFREVFTINPLRICLPSLMDVSSTLKNF